MEISPVQPLQQPMSKPVMASAVMTIVASTVAALAQCIRAASVTLVGNRKLSPKALKTWLLEITFEPQEFAVKLKSLVGIVN